MTEFATCRDLLAAHAADGRHVCIGLDTDVGRLPASLRPGWTSEQRVLAFNEAIIEATSDIACAYKPNTAFYEALGHVGTEALASTIAAVKRIAPSVPVILDAKRADIGSTNTGYATAAFDRLGADAITVHPYLGREALAPFFERTDKLIFVLARTSNPGADEFHDLVTDGQPLYRRVAVAAATSWNSMGNCGLVVGATYPDELTLIRQAVPSEVPILIPGVGAQGGDIEAAVAANAAVASTAFIINASRSILYASDGLDFADAARQEAALMDAAIRSALTLYR